MSELPSGWTLATLGDLIAADGIFSDGDWVETKDQDPDGNVRLTQLADVGEGAFRHRSSRFLRDDQATALNCTFLQPKDVLIARMPDPLGRACVFPDLPQPAVTAVDVCIVRPGVDSVDPRWLMWTINAPQFRTRILGLQSGTTRRRISRKNLGTIEFPVPPLNEQRRIVAAIEEHLSRLDAANASLAAGLVRLGGLRRSVLQAVTTADGDRCAVGEVAEVQGGIQKQPKRRPVKNRYPFLRVANVLRGQLDLSEVHEIELFEGELERLALRWGDLLVVEGNGSATQIGRSAMWHGEIDPCVHQNHLIRVRPGNRLDPRYLDLYWNAPEAAARIASVASSTSGLYTLSAAKVRSVEVIVPPIAEQRRLVAEVEQRLSVIDALRVGIERAQRRSRSLRRAVLERAFRGELLPQDPVDERASLLLERIQADRAASPSMVRRRVSA